ncbi:MAG TPA: DegT/DnrJ/EryC1/StrS family aminotransferase [archaeon]|nr:DegT/DnrJ/EryC1/StrS family aminotransferase [archaeon]
MKIPFMNLKRQNDALAAEYKAALGRVLEHGRFILGPEVTRFEEEFAAYQGVSYCLGTSSGTTALHLALVACGIGPGDEVITVPNSFAATAEAIAHCGAKPVFVDLNQQTYLMKPELIEPAVTPKTRAILPVHLYGCPAQMDKIMEIARRHGLTVIEDAAQAHGAALGGRRVGGFGRAAAFSFFPGKNLGALGDAGAVVTNDSGLYEKMRLLRDHGSPRKYYHELVGFNYRMDTFTGAVLSIKLGRLEHWTTLRCERAGLYLKELESSGLQLPVVPPGVKHVFHVFVIQSSQRDRLIEFLRSRGIQTNIHYPVPIHLQPAFADLGYGRGDFPVAEEAAGKILSLPLCADITEDEVRLVCDTIREGLSGIL